MRDFLKVVVFVLIGMLLTFKFAASHRDAQTTLPEPYATVRAQSFQEIPHHDFKVEAMNRYGHWQAERRSHGSDEVKAFHEFKNYWQADVPLDARNSVIGRIPQRPEGVIAAADKEPTNFKSTNIYDQFQEFLDNSYPEQKTGN